VQLATFQGARDLLSSSPVTRHAFPLLLALAVASAPAAAAPDSASVTAPAVAGAPVTLTPAARFPTSLGGADSSAGKALLGSIPSGFS